MRTRAKIITLLGGALAGGLIAQAACADPVETVLNSFTFDRDGGGPQSGLIRDSSGAFYGTTSGVSGAACAKPSCGAVFKLSPPAPGKTEWKETLLHVFTHGKDGAHPVAGLIADAGGALYGTTTYGGGSPDCPATQGCGTVFKLTPPADGGSRWKLSVLHSFAGPDNGDGLLPLANLFMDASGALYGTTLEGGSTDCNSAGCGTVFRLTPPSPGKSKWSETVLYSFTRDGGSGPMGALIPDGSGGLYGTTSFGGPNCSSCGVVFRLTPPTARATQWTENVLYVFDKEHRGVGSWAGLVSDTNGNLFGTTTSGGAKTHFCPLGCGTVFELSPPADGKKKWSETVLHCFDYRDGAFPRSALTIDSGGVLYGETTSGGHFGDGQIFMLTPPPPGDYRWTETGIYAFDGGRDGKQPEGGLLMDANGAFYGATYYGGADTGCDDGCGTLFQVMP